MLNWKNRSKHTWMAWALAALLVFGPCTTAMGATGTQKAAPGNKKPYTIMIYMNGSDLESEGEIGAATNDLKEMMAATGTDNVNLLIETGGTKSWKTPGISGSVNQRWEIINGELVQVPIELGDRNMGEADTLESFVRWGLENYPADRYGLFFWDHGSGAFDGFGCDERHNFDSLELWELNGALSNATDGKSKTFELIGFDACLMGNIETATAVAPFAKYLVASEELEPGHGWDYTPILNAIESKGTIDGKALGKVMVDGFKKQAKEWGTEDSITLSVTNLEKVPAINSKLDAFIKTIKKDLRNTSKMQKLEKARSVSEDYGNDRANDSYTDMVDLYDLAQNAGSEKTYKKAAAGLMTALKSAVVYQVKSETTPNAAGLSIYLPNKDRKNFRSKLERYGKIPFLDSYKTFVSGYTGMLLNDNIAIALEEEKPEEKVLASGDYQYQVQVNPANAGEISELYSILATIPEDQPDQVAIIGMDSGVEFNEKTGVISDTFDGGWVTLNGSFVSMFLDSEDETYAEYTAPVKLNGEEMNLLILYNDENPNGAVIGAWSGIDEETGRPDKEIYELRAGDVITPIYYSINLTTGEEGTMDGYPFTVDNSGIKINYEMLPDGQYFYGFMFTDFAQNDTVSDFVPITIQNGEIGNKKK